MAVKKQPEEHENHERWLVSYADFITLLFAFFVVMYSVSSRDSVKVKKLQMSLTKSFGTHDRGPMENANGRPFIDSEYELNAPISNLFTPDRSAGVPPEVVFSENNPLRKLQRDIEAVLMAEGQKRAVPFIKLSNAGLTLTLNLKGAFQGGAINPAFRTALAQITKRIHSIPNNILIDGMVAATLVKAPPEAQIVIQRLAGNVWKYLVEEEKIPAERIRQFVRLEQSCNDRPETAPEGMRLEIVVIRNAETDEK